MNLLDEFIYWVWPEIDKDGRMTTRIFLYTFLILIPVGLFLSGYKTLAIVSALFIIFEFVLEHFYPEIRELLLYKIILGTILILIMVFVALFTYSYFTNLPK